MKNPIQELPQFTELTSHLGGNDAIISRTTSPDGRFKLLATWHIDDSGDWTDEVGSFDDVPFAGAILHDTETGDRYIDGFRFFTPKQKDPVLAQEDYARACKFASGEIKACTLSVEVYACDVLLGESCIGNIASDEHFTSILYTLNDIVEEAMDEADNKVKELFKHFMFGG